MSPSGVLLTILLQILAATTCLSCDGRPRFPAIFTFGDTILDSGNNNFLFTLIKANHAPYGLSFPGSLSTGRFSDGKLISDFLASFLNIKDAIPPFLDPNLSTDDLRTGVSFASAGSGFDDLTGGFTKAISVSSQPGYFGKYIERLRGAVGDQVARDIIGNSLVFIVGGSDDLVINFYTANARQLQFGLNGYHDFLIQKIQDLVKTLYNMGSRNFLIAGLPPIGCRPKQITDKLSLKRTCIEDENRAAQSYNQKLLGILPYIQTTLPGSKLVYADIFSPIMDMITNPIKYGLTVTNKGCCGSGLVEAGLLCKVFSPVCPNPAQYLFWDSVNPTEYANRHLAQFLLDNALSLFPFDNLTNVPQIPNLSKRKIPPH